MYLQKSNKQASFRRFLCPDYIAVVDAHRRFCGIRFVMRRDRRPSMRRFHIDLLKRIQLCLALFGILLSSLTFSEGATYLDKTFAADGVAKISFGIGKNWATSGVTQSDGKIIIAGSLADSSYAHSIALARFNPNGILDKKFGDGGIIITKVGINSRSTGVAVMPDGRIVVAGWAFIEKGKEGITLAMYQADGSLDMRFGNQGFLIFPMEYSAAYVHSLAVQPDGKITVGGKITLRKEYRDQFFIRSVPDDYIFLARINSNGSFDTVFGQNGVVVTDIGGGAVRITSLTFQPDGKFIASGTRQKGVTSALVLARYNSNGVLDKHFGVEGLVNRTMENGRYKPPTVSVLADGRINLVGGYSLQNDAWLMLSRLRDDGAPDSTFGEGGTVTTRTTLWRYSNFIAIAKPDGKILVTGLSVRPPKPGQSQPPFYYSIGISRFLQNGQADDSFGPNGVQVMPIGAVTDEPVFMTVQENGRIVVAGHSDNQIDQQIILVGFVP